jgi:hypothetical protein
MFTFNHLKQLSRMKAFTLHIFASALVLLLMFAIVRIVWYPGQLFLAANGVDIMTIIVLVDLVLGPLIMLIIFNPKKASLKFDVSCVLIFQLLFLAYGFWSVFIARPAYIALVDNQFILVTANEIDPVDQEKSKYPEFKNLPVFGPVYVGTKLPSDEKKKEDILFGQFGGMGLQNLPEHFLPFEKIKDEAAKKATSVDQLMGISTNKKLELIAFEKTNTAPGRTIVFLPLRTKVTKLYIAIDKSNGSILGMI